MQRPRAVHACGAYDWSADAHTIMLGVSLRARLHTTQVMLGLSLRPGGTQLLRRQRLLARA